VCPGAWLPTHTCCYALSARGTGTPIVPRPLYGVAVTVYGEQGTWTHGLLSMPTACRAVQVRLSYLDICTM